MANYVAGRWRWKGLSARHRVEPLSGSKHLTVNAFTVDVCIQDDSWLVDITGVDDFLGLHDEKIKNLARVYMKIFFSQRPWKSSPAVLSISHKPPCVFHTYRLSLPVSTWLCSLLLCSVTSCASSRINVTGVLRILGSKSFIRRL
jgi:hypothetical protein